jgi:hypothetical protein
MDMTTRTRAAFSAAVGAFIEMSDPDAAEGLSAATSWIAEGFPRGDGPALAQAHLLMMAIDANPEMGAEALYNTAALAYGGKMGGYESLPLPRKTAFRVFQIVAAGLPRPAESGISVPDIGFKLVGLEPRNPVRMLKGIDMHDTGTAVDGAAVTGLRPAKKR